MRETTRRNRTAKGLTESEKLYRLLAENVADVIWTTDMDLRFTYVSPSIVRLRGYSSEETMVQTPEEVLTPASLEVAMQALNAAMAEAREVQQEAFRSLTLELEATCKDGSTVWTDTRIRFMRGSDGQPVGILGVCRDTTERKRAQEALRDSEARYHSLVEDTDAGIATIDLEGRFSFVNRALCQMTGYSDQEMVGWTFLGFLHPDDRERIHGLFQVGLTSTKDKLPLEFRVMHKNGHVIHMYSSPTPIKLGNKTLGFSAVITDISQLKQAEQQLLIYQK